METPPTPIVLYTALLAIGLVLLMVSDGGDDLIHAVAGMGAMLAGLFGLEAQSIKDAIMESREGQ